MSRPLAIALGLGLKPFVVFDGDGNRPEHKDEHLSAAAEKRGVVAI